MTESSEHPAADAASDLPDAPRADAPDATDPATDAPDAADPTDASAGDGPLDDDRGFAALGLRDELLHTLGALGYEEPTPIQRAAIPVLLEGRDVLGLAATGTGKTAAFALPLLQRIATGREGREGRGAGPSALVLVPTRELAMQVAEAIHKYGRTLGIRVLSVYGGAPMGRQLGALERGVDVVVATPGRALDHVGRGSLRLDALRVLVLDEADEMLDMGFEEDLTAILEATPTERQTALFSATMARAVAAIAGRYLRDPARVEIARAPLAAGTVPLVRQVAYLVPRAHKTAALGRVLDMEAPTSAIVFCRTRTEVDELTETLAARGYSAEALHGGMGQEARDRVMRRFRAGQLELLIATDVAARGLDVQHLSHVVNYDVPSAADAYVHRIGRTGRAGREGVAVTIAEPREHRLLRNIERVTGQRIEIATVPSVADLRTRRLELTRSAVREALIAAAEEATEDDEPTGLDRFRSVVQSLAGEFDLMDVAAAAVRVAHEATVGDGEGDEAEIPTVALGGARRERTGRDGPGGRGERFGGERYDRGESRGGSRGEGRGEWRGRRDEGAAGSRDEGERDARGERPRRGGGDAWSTARLYVGAGRLAGIRPGDLVGAIANEAGVDAAAIGAIEITDRFSLVELPVALVDDVADALRGATLRGKRVVVRRDREGGTGRAGYGGGRERESFARRPREARPRDDRDPGGRDGGPRRDGPRGRGRSDG